MQKINDRIEFAAMLSHEANRAHCQLNGDNSQVPWPEAPDWQKQSARNGVQQIIDNPRTTAEQSHENWTKEKLAAGWVYGPEKNPNATPPTHHCLVPYAELPETQRVKDSIFGAVVRAALEVFDRP